MKLTHSRSCTTVMVSPVSNAPRWWLARRPVQHSGAVEMPADAGQVEPGHRFDVVVEQLDPRGRSLDPVLIGARDEDARVKGVGELDVGGVEMRVR